MTSEFLELLQSLPDKMCPNDLVQLGLYSSKKLAISGRGKKNAPISCKEKNRHWYPRDQFVTFIKDHYQACGRGKREYSITKQNLLKLQSLPPFVNVKQIVKLGIYKNNMQAYACRLANTGPSYIRVGHKVLYLRDEVLKLLEPQL